MSGKTGFSLAQHLTTLSCLLPRILSGLFNQNLSISEVFSVIFHPLTMTLLFGYKSPFCTVLGMGSCSLWRLLSSLLQQFLNKTYSNYFNYYCPDPVLFFFFFLPNWFFFNTVGKYCVALDTIRYIINLYKAKGDIALIIFLLLIYKFCPESLEQISPFYEPENLLCPLQYL